MQQHNFLNHIGRRPAGFFRNLHPPEYDAKGDGRGQRVNGTI
jgi:hypothetical protein